MSIRLFIIGGEEINSNEEEKQLNPIAVPIYSIGYSKFNKKPKRLENSQLVPKNLSKLQRRATIADSTKQTTIISGQMSLHS